MKILCIGDSNTYGYDPRSYLGSRYPAEVRWTDRLNKCEVINCGVNGMTVPRNHLRAVGLIRTYDPDLVIVMLGTNDLFSGLSAEQIASHMEGFIDPIIKEGKPVLLISPPLLQYGDWVLDDDLVEESENLGEMYRKLADRKGCMFADAGKWDIGMTFDGVHFSPEGHAVFAQKLQEYLSDLPEKVRKQFMNIQKQQELVDHARKVLAGQLREIKKRSRQGIRYLPHLDPDKMKSGHMKKLTVLHSNDLHGDFLAEEIDSGLVGGVSMLSGYISKVRNEEQNVIYAIAGDMLRGSLIDSEFKGISTVEIMNLLTPDVVTVGNHEIDYGLTHLLFLEKCADFPIINSNMYVMLNGARLFRPHIILEIDGLKIMFIGAITKETLSRTRAEELIGTMIDIRGAADEIRKVIDAYKTPDIDMTVLLTHIGIEEDRKLAAELGPDCDIDIIIGGHSHTYLEEPCVVEGIPIVQAAVGTDQIGRFDILFDERNKRIDSYTWKLIPVTADNCPRDTALEEVIEKYKKVTDSKYLSVLTRFAKGYTHTRRGMETELGDLIADSIKAQLGGDIVMIASGTIRSESLGPIVTLQDFLEAFPYHDLMIGFSLTGMQIRKVMKFLMREESFDEDAHVEWFQFSDGFFCEYDRGNGGILRLTLDGKDIQDEEVYSIAIQSYFFYSIDHFLGISSEEAGKNGEPEELASSAQNVLKEYFDGHEYIKLDGEKRLLIHDPQ